MRDRITHPPNVLRQSPPARQARPITAAPPMRFARGPTGGSGKHPVCPIPAKAAAFVTFRISPAIYYDREFAEVGGLISYGSDIADTYRQSVAYVGRIQQRKACGHAGSAVEQIR